MPRVPRESFLRRVRSGRGNSGSVENTEGTREKGGAEARVCSAYDTRTAPNKGLTCAGNAANASRAAVSAIERLRSKESSRCTGIAYGLFLREGSAVANGIDRSTDRPAVTSRSIKRIREGRAGPARETFLIRLPWWARLGERASLSRECRARPFHGYALRKYCRNVGGSGESYGDASVSRAMRSLASASRSVTSL